MVQTTPEALTTAEELLLLAIDPKSGALHSHPTFRLSAALAGSVLLDLVADGSLTLVDNRVLAAASSNGHHRYAAALERIHNSPTSHTLAWWIDAFGFAGKEAKAWPIASLADQGVIEVQTRPLLLLFPRTRYRLIEPTARSAVATKVLKTLRADRQPEPQSTAITVMAAECGLLKDLLPRSERRALNGRVRALLQSEPSSPGENLTNEQHPALIAQVYAAVYRQGLAGVVQGT